MPGSLEENNIVISVLEVCFLFINTIYILKYFSAFPVVITTARRIGFSNVVYPDGEIRSLYKIVPLLG